MKKRNVFLVLCAACAFILSACSGGTETADESQAAVKSEAASASAYVSESAPASDDSARGKTLIAYFTMPINADTTSSASVVADETGEYGTTEYIARMIQEQTGGDVFQIKTAQQYPDNYDELVDMASKEQTDGARPELSSELENIDDYDTVILGYPNWWGDMPMVVYSFLDKYDFSGKIIMPYCTNGGSGLSNTADAIAELEPDAVVKDGLSIPRGEAADCNAEVTAWLSENA